MIEMMFAAAMTILILTWVGKWLRERQRLERRGSQSITEAIRADAEDVEIARRDGRAGRRREESPSPGDADAAQPALSRCSKSCAPPTRFALRRVLRSSQSIRGERRRKRNLGSSSSLETVFRRDRWLPFVCAVPVPRNVRSSALSSPRATTQPLSVRASLSLIAGNRFGSGGAP